MNNFNGSIIFLGIDVHKKTYSLTAICNGLVIKRDTMQANPDKLIHYCKKYFPGAIIESAYEAGFCGFFLHRKLENNHIHNKVVNPGSIEVSRERVKNDKRDSYKLAKQNSNGSLKCIHIPSEKRELLRLVSRLYETLSRQRHRIGCQIKGLLYQYNMIESTSKAKVSKKWINKILKIECSIELKYTIKKLTQTWLFVNSQISEVKKELELQAVQDSELDICFKSFYGIGIISSRILANELEDMTQFANQKQLYSFAGLTPKEYSSGESQHLGHISHQGRPIIRKILIQIAWKTIKKDPELRSFFVKVSISGGKKKAIVAVARKLLGRMKACLRDGRSYEIREVALT